MEKSSYRSPDATRNLVLIPANPARRAVWIQVADIVPGIISFESEGKSPIVIADPYGWHSFSTNDFPFFGDIYMINQNDAGANASFRFTEV
jgi:hypothetical protein